MNRNMNLCRLDQVLTYWAETQPHRKAFTELDANGAEVNSMTYGQLEMKSRAVAQEILKRQPHAHHALLAYPAGVDFMIGFFACIQAGVVAVPIPLPKRNRPNVGLAQIAKSSDATLLLSTTKTAEWIRPALEREADWPISIAYLASNTVSDRSGEPDRAIEGCHTSPTAFIQFTSGSTSQPKGVMITHANCLYNLQMCQTVAQATPESVFVSWLPHYHDLGLVAHLLCSFYSGSHCVILSPATFVAKPIQWLRSIARYKGEYTGAPNFAYQLCIDRISPDERSSLDLSCLKIAINAAETVNPQTVMDFCKLFAVSGFKPNMFLPAYGMAEATVFISSGLMGAPPVYKHIDPSILSTSGMAQDASDQGDVKTVVGCGTAKMEEDICIVDPQSCILLSTKQEGEIWVAGPHITSGYYNNSAATENAFGRLPGSNHRYLRTGDLGFMDEQGELYITGRIKDLIIINGSNYYPQDIEVCVEDVHPNIRRDCAVAFGRTAAGSEVLVIFLEIDKEGVHLAHTDVRFLEEVAERICTAIGIQFELTVSNIVFIKPMQLPKTSSGKKCRQKCKLQFTDNNYERLAIWPFEIPHHPSVEDNIRMLNIEKSINRVTSMGPDHLKVFSLFSQILTKRYQIRMADIDIDKSIFFYGIDSLNIIEIHAELEGSIGRSIPTDAFFHANTFIEMIDDIVASISDKSCFERNLSCGTTLREDIESAVAMLSKKYNEKSYTIDDKPTGKTLLTGASGFVGVTLLKEILERTSLDVVCMVRSVDESAALNRIKSAAARYDIRLSDGFENRVKIMIGDMTKKSFGLSDQAYRQYTSEIDSIYHCAAIDNFYLPYSVTRKLNVLGSIEMLEFALTGKLKPMYYISSCAVSLLENNNENTDVVGMVNGYSQSKYVVESILLELVKKGYPATNYRLGYLYNLRLQSIDDDASSEKLLSTIQKIYSSLEEPLIGDTDAFENFLAVIHEIGAFPDMDADFDLTPVEYVSKAIVTTSLLPDNQRKENYTFYNPVPMKWKDLTHYFEKEHENIIIVTLPEFVEKYEQYIRRTDKTSLKLLKSVVSTELQKQLNIMFRNVDNDHAESFKAWCPPCDARFTNFYASSYVSESIEGASDGR